MAPNAPSWLRAVPLLAQAVTRTMPWVTLISGCVVGTVYLAIATRLDIIAHALPSLGSVRLAFLPAIAALAFVPRAPFRPLTQTVPVPAWVAPAGHLLLAVPILAATCWAQLRVVAQATPAGHAPAVYPLIAQLTGWSAVAVAAAACTDRSRYADLGGAIAAPVSLGAVALSWYAPSVSRFLVEPPATAHELTITWYAIAAGAGALTSAAMRDQWHRYAHRAVEVRGRPLLRRGHLRGGRLR